MSLNMETTVIASSNDDDVMDVVPRGGTMKRKNSVAAQFVFKSAVDNAKLKLSSFLLDGR